VAPSARSLDVPALEGNHDVFVGYANVVGANQQLFWFVGSFECCGQRGELMLRRR
jgi:hypothetical protein